MIHQDKNKSGESQDERRHQGDAEHGKDKPHQQPDPNKKN